MQEKMKKRFLKWKFDKKMRMFVSLSIVTSTMVILLVSTISAICFARRQSIIMAEQQLYSMASNFDDSMQTYRDILLTIAMDSGVQQYLQSGEDDGLYFEKKNKANNVLNNISHMHSNINFIALIDENTGEYIYKGIRSFASTDFNSSWLGDMENSMYAGSALRVNFNKVFFNNYDEEYTMNIYYPVYSTKKIGLKLGTLCINLADNTLTQISEQDTQRSYSALSLVDVNGIIMADSAYDKIGSREENFECLKGYSGSFTGRGKLYTYQKIGRWNYYLVQSIPLNHLTNSSFHTVVALVAVIIAMTALAIYLTGRLIEIAYRPVNSLIGKMEAVSKGYLTVRINQNHLGDDFVKLAIGFNHMMDEIDRLMEQVKTEQHQLEQIRFNALQSQIQPHFLYNTLECIHWQAMADGNREVSTMVKALATYYRICLSKGKDVITLKQEIEHIRNYLIIQNMRYEDIIESIIEVDEICGEAMIPKMTLQPLIENAIYHGIKVKEGKKGCVVIQAQRQEDNLIIEVQDSGSGMTQEEIDAMNSSISEYDESFGYGVRNVNKRIELIFGKKYGLHFEKNVAGITVKVTLPYTNEKYGGI